MYLFICERWRKNTFVYLSEMSKIDNKRRAHSFISTNSLFTLPVFKILLHVRFWLILIILSDMLKLIIIWIVVLILLMRTKQKPLSQFPLIFVRNTKWILIKRDIRVNQSLIKSLYLKNLILNNIFILFIFFIKL